VGQQMGLLGDISSDGGEKFSGCLCNLGLGSLKKGG